MKIYKPKIFKFLLNVRLKEIAPVTTENYIINYACK